MPANSQREITRTGELRRNHQAGPQPALQGLRRYLSFDGFDEEFPDVRVEGASDVFEDADGGVTQPRSSRLM
jgi:hypothetical protein